MALPVPRSLFPAEPPRAAERLLIDFLLADARPEGAATCWFLDLYAQQQSGLQIGPLLQNVQLITAADPPPGPFDLAAIPLARQGEVELVRDQLQLMHERLAVGGTFVAATDNADDHWLHDQLKPLFDKVSRFPQADGVVYSAIKQRPLKKAKNFACEFAFRDGERLIHLRSRPGVFSHRSLDTGARALIEAMPSAVGQRVLDIGCGSGAVALAAACRHPDARVQAIDTNPRAVEATEWAAQKNSAENVTVTLDCDGSTLEPHTFDLALGNPPYYSNFRLAEVFIEIACRALKPTGQLLLVTKMPDWYQNNLKRWFGHFEQTTSRQFQVFICSQATSPSAA
jgi:16S rRNA G1207 methylase RsmC